MVTKKRKVTGRRDVRKINSTGSAYSLQHLFSSRLSKTEENLIKTTNPLVNQTYLSLEKHWCIESNGQRTFE